MLFEPDGKLQVLFGYGVPELRDIRGWVFRVE